MNTQPSFLCSLWLIPALITTTIANDWPNWRGPNQNGSIATGAFPSNWTTNNIQWKAKLPGKGTSVPIVHAKNIYLTSPSSGQDAVLAFDLAGKRLWESKLGPEAPPKHRSLASSGNASPVTDGKSIFVYFKSGNFAALDLNGNVRWNQNLVEKFGGENLFWDTGTSPVLTDQHVILARMHSGESFLAAFDKNTGEVKWKEPRNFKVPNENDNGYTTPVLFDHNGKKAILVWGADHLTAHDADTCKTLWTCDGFNPKGMSLWPHISTPVISGNVAIVPAGRDDRNQASVHGIDLTNGKRLWQRDDTGVFVPTPAEFQGRVYLLRNKGEIVCLDPKNGKTHFTFQLAKHRTPYYASPVIANGLLYAAREDGAVFTAKIESEKITLLCENDLGERFVATPVPTNDRLLLRGDNHLYCIASAGNAHP
ncbi:MAG TPA: PQQ-binding-like beta-propeller repeat protein [Verrucomicrobiae bacterium]|nr:PQQ-binding-like beta-propeller repeat protein [Verrucomicrobiae bacterium]